MAVKLDAVREHLSTLPPLSEGDTAEADTDFGQDDWTSGDEPMTLPDRPRDENGRFVSKPVTDPVEEENLLEVRLGEGEGEETEDAGKDDAETPADATPNDEAEPEKTEGAEDEAKTEEAEDGTLTPEQMWDDLRKRLEGLPEAEQADLLLKLGYIDEETAAQYQQAEAEAEEDDPYEPVGAIEEALHPILKDIVAVPERMKTLDSNFSTLTRELNDVLVAQRDALDAAVVQNALNNRVLQHFAELNQLEVPTVDVKAAVEGLRKGQSLDAIIDGLLKPVAEKNKARVEQARKSRPDTLHETANAHLQISKTDSMADIVAKMRGRVA